MDACERFVAGHEARIAAFVEEVRAAGGPAHRLDRSLESLEPLWRWFVEERLASAASGAGSSSGDDPWWAPLNPGRLALLDPSLATTATGLADYWLACLAMQAPGAAFIRSRAGAAKGHPVLRIPGRGDVAADLVVGIVAAIVAGVDTPQRRPAALRRIADVWLGLDPEYEALAARAAAPLGPWAVRTAEDGRFTHAIDFEDAIAERATARIGRLVEALRADPAIAEAVHEDREVVLVTAPALDADALRAIVDRAWDARPGPHADGSDDVP